MKIDRNLNLVIEIPRESRPSVFVHSAALSAEIVEQYFYLAGPTMNALVTRGFGLFAPRYAAAMMREVAGEQARMSAGGDAKAQEAFDRQAKERIAGFFTESRRKTHVLADGDNGWEMVPLADALSAGTIDDEEFSQIENAVVFFTFGCRSYLKEQRDAVAGGLSLCHARIESLNCTEFMNSLKTSTEIENSGESQDASPPSSAGSPVPDSGRPSVATTSHGRAPVRIGIGS